MQDAGIGAVEPLPCLREIGVGHRAALREK